MAERRNPGLDVVRSLAILMVLLSHLTFFLAPETVQQTGLWRLEIFGYYGVELFFVLSGFLIGRILLTTFAKPGSWRESLALLNNFYQRRWYRTLPLYYLVLLANAAYWPLAKFGDFPPLRTPLWQHFVFLQNYSIPGSGFFPESWSLAVEEWFYLLFAPMLLWWRRLTLKRTWPFGAGSFLCAFILFLLALRSWYTLEQQPIFDFGIRKNIFLRLDSLAIGVWFAWLHLEHPKLHRRLTAKGLQTAAVLILIGVACFFWRVGWSGWDNSLFARTLMPDLVSLAFALNMTACYYLLHRELFFFRWTSNLSYAIYLLHLPVFVSLGYFCRASWILTAGGMLVAVSIVYLLAWLSYHYLEQPVLKKRPQTLQKF